MYLLGQAVSSAELLRRYHNAQSVRAIAICSKGDVVLKDLAEKAGVEVVIYDPSTLETPA